MYKKSNNNEQGFTLIELSIVLVIIGFLIAGIATAIQMIEISKQRNLITQAQSLISSAIQFKIKYGTLPGDFPYASSYWPSTDCVAGDTNTDRSLCDGNGDGILSGTTLGTANGTNEGARALQHLALAGFITGNYIGGGPAFTLGATIVPAIYAGTGFNFASTQAQHFNDNISAFYNYSGNLLVLNTRFSGNGQPGGPALTNDQAYSIDNKIDDGHPGTGLILGLDGYDPSNTCVDLNVTPFMYVLSSTTINCNIHFTIK